ncbi:LOW QUALITY PROTEIN: telomeric repeat-binding factor 2 [Heteronotia binoei]|uniref:LOW QUALITY PROTEIN: telomeric repeat-binding factor 2 n=1 Tax=Heteronotia binoei TaxID=13085 RepID=UPI00292D0D39|nr:LOW QUALITY PROTEIN: telomeric repeat-binding factor 2 [Heteronotia binoei]
MAEARERALEEAVGRWVVLFYAHRAVQAYRAGRSQDFRQLRDILNAVLVRPLALEQGIHLQLRIVQLLSRLEENWTTDSGAEEMPFESALLFLETMKRERQLDAKVIENLRRKIKEAAVIACVKNQEFEKANRLLKTHLSKDPSIQKTRWALQSIVREKNFSHPTVWNFSFKAFQQEVLLCLEDCLDGSEPFLLDMARKKLTDTEAPGLSPLGAASEETVASEDPEEVAGSAETKKDQSTRRSSEGLTKPTKEGEATGVEERRPEAAVVASDGDMRLLPPVEEERAVSERAEPPRAASREEPPPALGTPETAGRCSPKRPAFHSLSALREAFKALHDSTDADAAFSKLDETDWAWPKQTPVPHRAKRQREEEEAAAAAPGTSPSFQKTRCLVTISRLVQGCDAACACDSCASPEVSAEPPGTPVAQPADPETPTSPRAPQLPRLPKRRWRSWREEKDTWSEEEDLFDHMSSGGESTNTSVTSGAKKQKWTAEETEWIREGVKKYGEGNWKAIFKAYRFRKRTPVMIKDRWRTMKKLGLN